MGIRQPGRQKNTDSYKNVCSHHMGGKTLMMSHGQTCLRGDVGTVGGIEVREHVSDYFCSL